MEDSINAAQKVFAIPELLILIFSSLPSCYCWQKDAHHGGDYWCEYTARCDFASYMLVNKLWLAIAADFAWRQCGHEYYWSARESAGKPRMAPSLSDLARMAPSSERVQWYAKHIRVLHINEEHDSLDFWHTNSSKADALDLIPEVNFPRLKEIALAGDTERYRESQIGGVLRYLLPRIPSGLTRLSIFPCSLSNSTLDLLKVIIVHCGSFSTQNFCADHPSEALV